MSNFTSIIILILAIALSFYAGYTKRQIILIPTHELSDSDLLNMETLVPEAKDTFFYFYDFDCQYCSEFLPTLKNIHEENTNRLDFKFINTAIFSSSSDSLLILGAECSISKGLFFEYSKAVYDYKTNDVDVDINRILNSMNVNNFDNQDFSTCLRNKEMRSNVIDNELLHTTINVSKTPSYILGENMFSGVMDEQILNEIIEVLVSKK
jgi:protein-disulfide isomerase